MKKYAFTKNGKTYKRVSKVAALAAFKAGKTIYLSPCNLRPFGLFYKAAAMEPQNGGGSELYFDNYVTGFEFYNCVNQETGKYAAYYLIEK